jgi:hypothetical protein
LHQRFGRQPLAILLLHDASLTSLANYRNALAPIRNNVAAEIPIRFLLDRAPAAPAPDGSQPRAGEEGSGQTASIYEAAAYLMLVIDKRGTLISAITPRFPDILALSMDQAGHPIREYGEQNMLHDGRIDLTFSMNAIESTVERQFGLPARPISKPSDGYSPLPKVPVLVRGTVIDVKGEPIEGAEVSERTSEKTVKTGPTGGFSLTLAKLESPYCELTIGGAGLAPREFWFAFRTEGALFDPGSRNLPIEPNGVIPQPLQRGPGVTVTGRVMQFGKPVSGVTVGLKHADSAAYHSWEVIDTTTDGNGSFVFRHLLPATRFWVYVEIGSLKDNGAVIPVRIQTTADGATDDVGELHVQEGRTLAGRLVRSDGKAIAPDTLVQATCPNVVGSPESKLDDNGRFKFNGLPAGFVTVTVHLPQSYTKAGPLVSLKNKCLHPGDYKKLVGRLDHDVTDLTILLEPDPTPRTTDLSRIDPAILADFNDAKAGSITGVPPGDYPPK